MQTPARKPSFISKGIKLLLKLAVMVICLWYVSGKIELDKAKEVLQKANWLLLLAALIAFAISKLIAAIRLNIYFKNIRIELTQIQNIRLYLLGMFYNLFLPGSISGDAYKVILLSKQFPVSYKKTTAAVLLDRFSGLLGLGIIGAIYSFFVFDFVPALAITSGIIVLPGIFYFIINRYFSDFTSSFWTTLLLGLLVQAVQVVCIYFIMSSLNITHDLSAYIFIFLLSSVVSVLPLTIGGLGIREVVFLQGAAYFHLAAETSVIISLLFYLITLVVSATGAWFIFNDPLKRRKDP